MKNLSKKLVRASTEIVANRENAAGVSPLLSRLPACLFIVSLVVYLFSSEGIRNHLAFLHGAVSKVMEYIK